MADVVRGSKQKKLANPIESHEACIRAPSYDLLGASKRNGGASKRISDQNAQNFGLKAFFLLTPFPNLY